MTALRESIKSAIRLNREVHPNQPDIDALRYNISRNPRDHVSRELLADSLAEAGQHHEAAQHRALAAFGRHVVSRVGHHGFPYAYGDGFQEHGPLNPIEEGENERLFNTPTDPHMRGFRNGLAEQAAWVDANMHIPGIGQHRPPSKEFRLGRQMQARTGHAEVFGDGSILRAYLSLHDHHSSFPSKSAMSWADDYFSPANARFFQGRLGDEERELIDHIYGPRSEVLADWDREYGRYR